MSSIWPSSWFEFDLKTRPQATRWPSQADLYTSIRQILQNLKGHFREREKRSEWLENVWRPYGQIAHLAHAHKLSGQTNRKFISEWLHHRRPIIAQQLSVFVLDWGQSAGFYRFEVIGYLVESEGRFRGILTTRNYFFCSETCVL